MPNEKLFYLGVKALIRNNLGQVLLLQIRKGERTYWDLPGGRINEGEQALEALAREVNEETGIENIDHEKLLGMALTTIAIPITPDRKGGLILAVYACDVVAVPEGLQTEEGVRAVWCDKGEALENISQFPLELLQAITAELS